MAGGEESGEDGAEDGAAGIDSGEDGCGTEPRPESDKIRGS